jgi:aromatic ring hydroxylase
MSASHAMRCRLFRMDTSFYMFRDSVFLSYNRFDHSLSGRFDEQDAFVIFDNVEVPRNRVFCDGNLPVYNTVMSASWRANAMHQTMIRAWTKLEFAWGIACRMAEAIAPPIPPLSRCWARSGVSRS